MTRSLLLKRYFVVSHFLLFSIKIIRLLLHVLVQMYMPFHMTLGTKLAIDPLNLMNYHFELQ